MATQLYRTVEPVLLQLERDRKRQARSALPLLILAIGGGLLAVVAFADILFSFWLQDDRSPFIFAAAILLAFVTGYRYAAIDQSYRRQSRRRLVARIFEELDCEVKPECRSELTTDDLRATRLLAPFDRSETDCVVEAVHGRTPIRLFYVHTEYIYDTYTSKGRTRKKYRTRFKGTILLAHPLQQFPLTLVVEPKTKGGGSLQQAVNLNQQAGLEYVPSACEDLAIYADHPELAQRLITLDLLEESLELSGELGTPLSFSYIGSVLCLAIGDEEQEHKLDLRLTQSLLDSRSIIHLVEELSFGLDLVKAFEASPTL